MNIGIFKPGKKVYFYENTEDHASWSAEVTNVARIFVTHGEHVMMLSETDLINEEHLTTIVDRPIDRIYVFNGGGLTDEVLEGLKLHTNDIRLIITDLKLIPANISKFSYVYSQSKRWHTYGHIEENALFGYELIKYEKDIPFYFGGTERNRLKACIEYLWRPDVIWKGKSAYFGFNNYIPFHEHVEMLKRTKYTIIIGDEDYNAIGFVTPRFYECLKYGILPFVDNNFDPDGLIVPQNSILRVNSYYDMMEQIKIYNEYPEKLSFAMKILTDKYLTPEMKRGDNIYDILIN